MYLLSTSKYVSTTFMVAMYLGGRMEFLWLCYGTIPYTTVKYGRLLTAIRRIDKLSIL